MGACVAAQLFLKKIYYSCTFSQTLGPNDMMAAERLE